MNYTKDSVMSRKSPHRKFKRRRKVGSNKRKKKRLNRRKGK
tara:strand:+ start:474 stop:596 length:123 start_codon:yes stop_codon:yes gene_type:complete